MNLRIGFLASLARSGEIVTVIIIHKDRLTAIAAVYRDESLQGIGLGVSLPTRTRVLIRAGQVKHLECRAKSK
jgi:hypothetical protein